MTVELIDRENEAQCIVDRLTEKYGDPQYYLQDIPEHVAVQYAIHVKPSSGWVLKCYDGYYYTLSTGKGIRAVVYTNEKRGPCLWRVVVF